MNLKRPEVEAAQVAPAVVVARIHRLRVAAEPQVARRAGHQRHEAAALEPLRRRPCRADRAPSACTSTVRTTIGDAAAAQSRRYGARITKRHAQSRTRRRRSRACPRRDRPGSRRGRRSRRRWCVRREPLRCSRKARTRPTCASTNAISPAYGRSAKRDCEGFGRRRTASARRRSAASAKKRCDA